MSVLGIPKWINRDLLEINNISEVDDLLFEEVKSNLRKVLNKDNPMATVVIPAWNEELNILRCIDSLSRTKSKFDFNILVINNNSEDSTQEVLDRLGIDSYTQPIQGCGPARQMGQVKSKGKYVLMGDADCLYPEIWVETMINHLKKPKTVCVYGKYSFLPHERISRFQFFIYERLRDVLCEIRHINRPYLNAYGMSMGYIRELGLKEGFVDRHIRGEDGRMCFDLMKYGKVRVVRSFKNRVWTPPRTIVNEGSLWDFFVVHFFRTLANFGSFLKKEKDHDTKTSSNTEYDVKQSVDKIKKSFSLKNKE
ncbi:MAG: glycosyltransferase family A protein [Bacteroidota bacterium]